MPYQLVGQQEDGLQGELAVAEVEQVFERGTQEVNDHGVVVALRPEPTDEGNTDATSQSLVDLGFILELRMLSLDRLELNGDFFPRDDVDSEVDVTWREIVRIGHKKDDQCYAPKEPEPIFFPSLYFPPTRRSSLWVDESAIVVY